jgi:hypothetical protein
MSFTFVFVLAAISGAASSPDTIRFKAKEVLVSDSAGVPLFRGRRDFVLKLGHNPGGEVVAYDARTKRVRISKAGTELWVDCADLEPMTSSCQPLHRQARAGAIRGTDDRESSQDALVSPDVPTCPGDPRCPRAD